MVPQMVVLVWMLILGAVVGSFLNVCIYRLPWEKSILWPGSHCPNCLRPVRFYDNIPIFSWFLLRGRCRDCGAKFSPRYMLVEALAAALFGFVFWLEAPAAALDYWRYACHMTLLAALIVATFIDMDFQIIPDSITVPGTLLGIVGGTIGPGIQLVLIAAPGPALPLGAVEKLLYALLIAIAWVLWIAGLLWLLRRTGDHAGSAEVLLLAASAVYLVGHVLELLVALGLLAPKWPGWVAWFVQHPHWQGFATSLVGMLVGAGLIWVVRVIGTAALRKEAMGFGDVTLMAMVGAFLGWQAVVVVFFMAPFMGVAVGVTQWVLKGDNVLPYGPYLSLAAALTLIFWPGIWQVVALRLGLLGMLGLIPVAVLILLFLPILLLCLRRTVRLASQILKNSA